MKAAIYVRVSTKDKQDINTQIEYLKDYAARNKLEITKTYQDIGESGSKDSRPSFDAMLNDMRSGEFKGILVYKLDRIGRSLQHLINLFEEFNNKGIDFISATQNINTTTPEGKMFLRMLMVLSEYERKLIVDRINAGLKRARKQGKPLGRPKGAKDKGRRRKSGYINRWLRNKV
jgi:DNA invertase Pin-like site-specific DNA recombinase